MGESFNSGEEAGRGRSGSGLESMGGGGVSKEAMVVGCIG